MKKSAGLIHKTIVFLLILLWAYTAASKLSNYNDFRVQMSRQALPLWLKTNLLWALPSIELTTAGLLLFKRTELIGLLLSLFLMSAFSVYVGLAVSGYFSKVPCSCGGVIKAMGWDLHFLFNLFFLLLSCAGIYFTNRERRDQS